MTKEELLERMNKFADIELKSVENSGWGEMSVEFKEVKDKESYSYGYWRGINYFKKFIIKMMSADDIDIEKGVTDGIER